MSMVRDVLTVLSRESGPVTAGEIRAGCPGDPIAQSVHTALNSLCSDGRVERIAEAGQRGTYVITDLGKQWLAGKKPAATVVATEAPKASAEAITAPTNEPKAAAKPKPTVTRDPAFAAASVVDQRIDQSSARKLMRQAAALLLDAADDRPLTEHARNVIQQLVKVAA